MRRFFFLIPLLALLIYFLPFFSAIPWFKNHLEGQLAKQLGGNVQIERISLSWFGKQKCENVKWIDKHNNLSIHAESVILTMNLIDSLGFRNRPIHLIVHEAHMACPNTLSLLQGQKDTPMQIHFSPIKAKIENGLVNFERVDLDINHSMRVTSWGKIDLNKQQMDIILGFYGKTLKKFFKNQYIPEHFLFQIPIKGGLNGNSLEDKVIKFFLKNFF